MIYCVKCRSALLTILLIFSFTLPALAEPVLVESGTTPAEGLVQVGLKELWRAGGEDDEVFFGTLGSVRTDSAGQIYLMDSQLSEVHIYSPEGEYLRTVGREGDGPGEVRRPSDLFITADGTIHLLQGFPGRIVKLTPDGLPAGEATFSAGPDAAGQFGVLIGGRSAGDNILLAGIRMTFGGSISKQTYFLSLCDEEGLQKHALLEKEHEINYADFALDELKMDFVWGRMAVGPGGRIYAGPERNSFKINVYDPQGNLEKVISRPYQSRPRTEKQRKLAHQIIEAVGANYPTPPREITIEDTEPVLSNVMVTADGRLWTQTSAGNIDAPDGCWVVLDVFSPEGKFEKQVAFKGQHNASRDAINVLPDGKVVVIVGALDAWLNQQGAGAKEEEAPEGDPLEVICYQLEW